MAKFFYRMQNILDVKYKLEDTAKQEYADARRILNLEEEKLESLINRKNEYRDEYNRLIMGSLDFLEIEATGNAMDIMDMYIEEQREVVKKCNKELERARVKLQQVMQERKMHEKLKEKQFDEFVKELNSAENKETDEVVSYQYNNSNMNTED